MEKEGGCPPSPPPPSKAQKKRPPPSYPEGLSDRKVRQFEELCSIVFALDQRIPAVWGAFFCILFPPGGSIFFSPSFLEGSWPPFFYLLCSDYMRWSFHHAIVGGSIMRVVALSEFIAHSIPNQSAFCSIVLNYLWYRKYCID